MLIVVVIAIAGIGRRSMYGTEEATMWVARQSVHHIFGVLSNTDAVHGTYYLLVHGMFRLFGSSVTVLRLPSVVGTAAIVVLVALITKRLTGSMASATVAAVVTAVTPYIVFYELSGRSYALDAALALGATLALLRALDEVPGRRWTRWLPYTVLLAVGGYMHEMTLLVIASHAVTLLLARVPRRTLGAWTASAAAGFVAVTPLFVVSLHERRQLSWIRTPGRHAMWILLKDFFGPSRVAIVLMLALIVIGVLPLRRRLDLRTVALPLFVLPTVLLVAESHVATPLYGGPRYVLYSLPAGIMLASLGLLRIAAVIARSNVRFRLTAAATGVIVIAAAQAGELLQLRTPAAYPQDFAAAAAYVAAHARPGDTGLFVGPGYELAPLGYPDDFRNVSDLATAETPMQAANYYGLVKPVPAILAAMRHQQRIWAIGALYKRGRHRYRAELRLLRHDFRDTQQIELHGVGVALFQRRTGEPPVARRTNSLP